MSKSQIFANILYSRVTTEHQYMQILENLENYLQTDTKLIIIDSFGFLLKDMQRADNITKSKLLCKLGLKLQEIACERDLCVILTNKLTYTEGEGCKPQFGES